MGQAVSSLAGVTGLPYGVAATATAVSGAWAALGIAVALRLRFAYPRHTVEQLGGFWELWSNAVLQGGVFKLIYFLIPYDLKSDKRAVGDEFADAPVLGLDGRSERLSDFVPRDPARPLVINMGSWTCPCWAKELDVLRAAHARFGPFAQFLNVYIAEAHPEDGWDLKSTEIKVDQPKSNEERLGVARAFCERHPFPFPMVVDTMTNDAALRYSAMPEKLIVIENGRVTFISALGPEGYDPRALVAFLEARFPKAPKTVSEEAMLAARTLGGATEKDGISHVGVQFDAARAEELVTDAARRAVEAAVASTRVVVFSKSYCPFSKRAAQILRDAGAGAKGSSSTMEIVELDERADGAAVQAAVFLRSGVATVPVVFVGGTSVGGCDQVQALARKGRLAAMLTA